MRNVIHIVTSLKNGGAEVLVQKLLHFKTADIKKGAIYFSCKDCATLDRSNEFCLGVASRNLFAVFKIRKELKKLLEVEDSVIVHAHLTWPLFYVALASIGLSVTLVYTEHSTHNKRRNCSLLKFIDRWAYTRYSKIIGISKATSSSLSKWLGNSFDKKIVTINNGAELFPLVSRDNLPAGNKLKLLSVGSLKSLKGFDTTIQSLQGVKDVVESYTIVGTGPDFEKLQALARACGVDDIVHFAGWTDNPESYYINADVLLIPSHWEGFGLVAVEGMSTGLPVIASNVDGLNEVVNANLSSVILIDEITNPMYWSNAIVMMREKLSTQASQMAIDSRNQAEKFDISKMLLAYDELYKTLD
jgi:glycosyltransferase involved in cell wall biosynthesis